MCKVPTGGSRFRVRGFNLFLTEIPLDLMETSQMEISKIMNWNLALGIGAHTVCEIYS